MSVTRRALLAGSAGLGLAGFGGARAQAPKLQDVALAVSSTSFVIGGVRIGERAHLFERNGIALRIIVMDSGNSAMAALIGGSVQFAVTGPSEVLAARVRGQDFVIVTNLYRGFAGSVVLSKAAVERLHIAPDAPVKERLHALDGLVLAEPSATSALLAPLRAAAEEAGAHPRFTYMAQGTMPAALENDAIAGMVASFPFAGTPILRGTGVLWINGPGGELPQAVLPASSSCIQTSAAFARNNPDIVRRMQQSVLDIAAYIQSDPAGARAALGAAYAQLTPAEIDLAFNQQWRNWTQPRLTVDDMRQEVRLLALSVKLPGLDELDPASALLTTP
jgi:ABC-type nitrate/sulfonate/bicarbonate transport system substrate-binding protein